MFSQRIGNAVIARIDRARTLCLSVAIATVAATALISVHAVGGPGGGGGGDSIGSLPGSSGGGGNNSATQGNGGSSYDVLPNLALVGKLGVLKSMILDAAGTGWVETHKLDNEGKVEMIFHGHINLWLDRTAFDKSNVQVQLDIPSTFGSSVEHTTLNGRLVSRAVEPAVDMPLAVESLSTSGILDLGQVVLSVVNAKHAKQVVELDADIRRIHFEQRF